MGSNILRICSEALYLAVGSCYCPGEVERGIREKILSQNQKCAAYETKLMFTIFNGGKALGSNIKFSKFYLLVEAQKDMDYEEIMDYFLKFQQALLK